MLRILSALAALPFALVLLVAAGLYTAYDEIDPCRVLAVERTRLAEAEMGSPVDKTVEPWMRAQTSQLSTGQCAREIVHSWKARAWGGEEKADNHDDGRDNDYADNPDDRVGDYGNSDYSNDDFGNDYDDNGDQPHDNDEPDGE